MACMGRELYWSGVRAFERKFLASSPISQRLPTVCCAKVAKPLKPFSILNWFESGYVARLVKIRYCYDRRPRPLSPGPPSKAQGICAITKDPALY
jgi:hypothetical protein